MIIEDHYVNSSYSKSSKIHIRIKTNNPNYSNSCLLLSGKTLPFTLNYDMPFDSKSSADLLAETGITCIMVNFIGYGESSKYPEMDLDENLPITINSYNDILRDITDVMSWLEANKQIKNVCILSWSASPIPALMYTIKYPEKINGNIVMGLYSLSDKNCKLVKKNYSILNPDNMQYRRYSNIPKELKEEILPQYWFNSWIEEFKKHYPIKYPEGVTNEKIDLCNGDKNIIDYIDWQEIKNPISFITGEWDRDANITDYYEYCNACSSEFKNVKIFPNGTHWMIIEKNRNHLIEYISRFVKRVSVEDDQNE